MLSPSLDPYLDACLYDSSPGDDLIKDGRIDKENGAKRKIDLENEGKDSCNEEQDSGIPPNPSKKPRVTFDLRKSPKLLEIEPIRADFMFLAFSPHRPASPPGLDFAEGSLDSIHEAVVPDWDQPGPSGERSPPTPPSVMGPGGDTIGTIDESNKENIPPPSVTSTPPSTVDDQPHLAATTEEEDDETALPATLELDSPTWQNLSEQDGMFCFLYLSSKFYNWSPAFQSPPRNHPRPQRTASRR